MQLIKPSNISGEIMTLMEEANKKVILVSPYCQFSYWKKLINRFQDLQHRNIEIEFYVREDQSKTIQEVEALNIIPILVPRLHAKLYFNEKYAIVSSMNLLKSSDDASLDIAYKTETESEYLELMDFYKRYLLKHKGNSNNQSQDWGELLYNDLCEAFQRDIDLSIEENKILFNTGLNNYEAFIANTKNNCLRIMGILSQREFQKAIRAKKHLENYIGSPIELYKGKFGNYDTIWTTVINQMNSNSLETLQPEEIERTIEMIVRFAVEVDNFKMSCR